MRLHAALVTTIVLLAVAFFTLRVAPPTPAAPLIKVRWAPTVDEGEQLQKEAAYRLRRDAPHDVRTWNYRLEDAGRENIRALVTDPEVEDTDGLDRRAFRLPLASITIAERITRAYPSLEESAGPGFTEWVSVANIWPALLAAGWLILLSLPRVRAFVSRGVPPLSPVGLGLFRIAFGVSLILLLPTLPDGPFPRALHRSADWFADWQWVHALAEDPAGTARVRTVAIVALTLFAAGVLPRLTYLAGVSAITAQVFVHLQHASAHDWGLPLVALWGLALVPWDAGLTLVPFRRARAGDTMTLGYAVWVPGAMLGIAWLAAAYAKLDSSGLDWVLGGAVKYHFVEDFHQAPTNWGLWVATQPLAAVAFSLAAILVEALFILHVFFAHPLVRIVAGIAGLALLVGFYALQGVVWPLWWVLFIAFVPWDALGSMLERTPASPGVLRTTLTRPQVAFLAAVVCVQIFASARRAEIEPFISDFGMYSWTWPSLDAFDRNNARKYRSYRYTMETPAGVMDVTGQLRTLPAASDVLTDAIDHVRDGEGIRDEIRELLRVVGAAYQARFERSPPQLTVLLDEQAFDWTRGRFFDKASALPIGTMDLREGTFVLLQGNTGGV